MPASGLWSVLSLPLSRLLGFNYDQSRFSRLDKAVVAYAQQVEKNGWKEVALAEVKKDDVLVWIFVKDDRILTISTRFKEKKIVVEVVKSKDHEEILNKMLEYKV